MVPGTFLFPAAKMLDNASETEGFILLDVVYITLTYQNKEVYTLFPFYY
tara:strand:- start:418 stop:564 length:147 start_codon:yes stop_codon:yes gene_type:complete